MSINNDFEAALDAHFSTALDLAACAAIFRVEHIGSIYIQRIVPQDGLMLLQHELNTLRKKLVRAPSYEGKVEQNFLELYLGPAEEARRTQHHPRIALNELPAISALACTYLASVYNPLGTLANFPSLDTMPSIGIHYYPAYEGRITYHRDYVADRYLIGIFSLIGKARFSVARSRDGDGEVSCLVEPGDLVLMRGPFNESQKEKDKRPFHKVETLNKDRCSIMFRNRHHA